MTTPPTCTHFGYYLFPALLGKGVQALLVIVTLGNTASAGVLQKAGIVFNRILPADDTARSQWVDDEECRRTV